MLFVHSQALHEGRRPLTQSRKPIVGVSRIEERWVCGRLQEPDRSASPERTQLVLPSLGIAKTPAELVTDELVDLCLSVSELNVVALDPIWRQAESLLGSARDERPDPL